MSLNRHAIIFVTLLLGGCNNDPGSNAPAGSPQAPLPGVYVGVFPCDGCPGITSTLWLRSDGSYFFKQRYAADDSGETTDTYSLGRWNSSADGRAIELRGDGPTRVFTRAEQDSLLLQTYSDIEHRLYRDATTAISSDTIRMNGMMQMLGENASFTECRTGLVAPVNKGGDYSRFWRIYRSAARRREPAYVQLEGRFSWSNDGTPKSLTIEHFITVKSTGAC